MEYYHLHLENYICSQCDGEKLKKSPYFKGRLQQEYVTQMELNTFTL